MNDLDAELRNLRHFGLDPEEIREYLLSGRIDAVMEALKRAEETLEMRRLELEDLRDALLSAHPRKRGGTAEDVLSDEDLDMLNAAGAPPPPKT